MTSKKQEKINQLIKVSWILISILFAMPSIIYLVQKKTVFQFGPYFQFLYDMPISRITQTLLYIFLLTGLAILYFITIKKRTLSKSKENVYLYCHSSCDFCTSFAIYLFRCILLSRNWKTR